MRMRQSNGQVFYIAKGKLSTIMDRYIFHMTKWEHGPEWILDKLFEPEVLSACRSGYKFAAHYNRLSNENFRASGITVAYPQKIWDSMEILAPNNKFQVTEEIPELTKFVSEINDIRFQYAKVKHVLDWFFDGREDGVREYCPWVCALIPDNKLPKKARAQDPRGIKTMLPLIREVATTMATAMLLPTQEIEPVHNMNFTFPGFNRDYIGVGQTCLTV